MNYQNQIKEITHENNRMKLLGRIENKQRVGFFQAYEEAIKTGRNKIESFLSVSDEFFEYWRYFPYTDYNSFMRVYNRFKKKD